VLGGRGGREALAGVRYLQQERTRYVKGGERAGRVGCGGWYANRRKTGRGGEESAERKRASLLLEGGGSSLSGVAQLECESSPLEKGKNYEGGERVSCRGETKLKTEEREEGKREKGRGEKGAIWQQGSPGRDVGKHALEAHTLRSESR